MTWFHQPGDNLHHITETLGQVTSGKLGQMFNMGPQDLNSHDILLDTVFYVSGTTMRGLKKGGGRGWAVNTGKSESPKRKDIVHNMAYPGQNVFGPAQKPPFWAMIWWQVLHPRSWVLVLKHKQSKVYYALLAPAGTQHSANIENSHSVLKQCCFHMTCPTGNHSGTPKIDKEQMLIIKW